ncbi:MFS transporter [Actinoalloteichus hymeniacidonis]|uniref:Drug resistance transporter, EmrB/QacA subfamily n=1 Tax=Actinoalloteichus hymeniacidonis TaxID=340345 RepID=A0AAC9HLI1_9PSEU|nr:MFS transporter [Actinoalloteichus hymeniacidonis]AOS61293.1 drug resistance transporter, EmrB/QacA subfamily [Actinoalloteichus hymeniacidonis]MBB5910703.1 EmrB/QacA subfamily drug resistance transporter [Actinoalloteichus hymeniacidonis]
MAPGASATPGRVRLADRHGRLILLATVLGSAVAGIDATVVNVALPALGADLGASFEDLQWTLNGYTLTLASLILLGGALGDRVGRRRVFVIGACWFALASALCAVSVNVEMLVAARMLQGIGGALLTPGSLALISASLHPDDRAKAVGAWSGFGGIATAIGPFLGGWLVEGPGWRWIFLINLPLAAVVVAVTLRSVPESHDTGAKRGLDITGGALGAIGLGGITFALISAGDGWSSTSTLAVVIGVIASAAFVVTERRSSHPMLPTDIFANRQFTSANLVTATVYTALGGVFFLLVVQLQASAGFSPLLAGTALLPVTLIMLACSARVGAWSARIGPKRFMSIGPLVAAAGVLLLLRVGPGSSYVTDVLPAVIVFGLGLSLIVAPLTATVLAAAETRHAGVASGVNNAIARAAQLLAVAVLPVIAGISGDDYQNADAFTSGFRIAMLVCAGILVLGAVVAMLMIRDPRPTPARRPEQPHHCAIEGPPVQAEHD